MAEKRKLSSTASRRFGEAEGEDPAFAAQMQTFTEVALERIDAKFLVRVLSHLETGRLTQSARGLVKGRSRRNPKDGPLEKAMEKGDTEEVARLNEYLKIVEEKCPDRNNPLLPLSFLQEWRREFRDAFKQSCTARLKVEHGEAIEKKAAKFAEKLANRLSEPSPAKAPAHTNRAPQIR